MPLPRVRFTVRRMMVAVAVVAIGVVGYVNVEKDRTRRVWIAAEHAYEAELLAKSAGSSPAKFRWHEAMAAKYLRAARYPFLPVAPDPPEPE